MNGDRSSLREIRNPLLAIPEVIELMESLDSDQAHKWRKALFAIKAHCVAKEQESYRKRKGPMTGYWMGVGTYCKHLANVILHVQRKRQSRLALE